MTSSKPRRNNWFMILGCIFGICLAGMGLLICAALLPPIDATPTPTATLKVEAIIQATQMAFTTTALFTSTNLPTLTRPPTAIPSLTLVPTNTVIFVLPTRAPATQLPTSVVIPINPPSSGNTTCSCSGDDLNCADFFTDEDAQACMEYCISIGAGDIHKLDGDNNGLACDGV